MTRWNGIKVGCSFKGCRRKVGADALEHETKEADGWSALTGVGSTDWICPGHSLRVRGLLVDGADSEHYVDRPQKQRKPSTRGRYFPRWPQDAYERAFPASADQLRFLESIRRGRR